MPAKKKLNSKGNVLPIILIILVVLVVGGIVFYQVVLPKLINKTVNTVVDTALNASLENMNFDNAQLLQINQDLSKNEGMLLQMGINKGKISIDANSQGDVLLGEVKHLGIKPTVDYQTDKDKVALFTIKSSDQAGESITLHLSQKTNGRIDLGIGAGIVDIDLSELDLPYLNIGAGAGIVNVKFSKKTSTTAKLAAGAGKLNLSIPKGLEYRMQLAQGSNFNLEAGTELVKINNGYQTKGFDKATVKADIIIGQATGGFEIQTIE